MIVCDRCTKENQDHYKFCLGCGAELPRDAKQKDFKVPTPPSGMQAVSAADVAKGPSRPEVPSFGGAPAKAAPPPDGGASEPAEASDGGGQVTCEKCGKVNPTSFKFCGACGHNLMAASGAPPAKPSASSSPVATAPTAMSRGSLVLIRPDGTEGESFPLLDSETMVGRDAGGVFASDVYLSPEHSVFAFDGDVLTVTDQGSLNGIYWRAEPEVPVPSTKGQFFRVGQEIIRFTSIPAPRTQDGVDLMGGPAEGLLGRISLVIGREATGNAYCVPAEGLHLGRERGDIIFPDDGYVSGLHCRIYADGDQVVLMDVGSSNGTFIRVVEKMNVPSGMLILMGQQLFRVEY